MLPAPKRRWLRFSLRSMFVLVTLVAIWLGWNVHVVRQRNDMTTWLSASGRGRAIVVSEEKFVRMRSSSEALSRMRATLLSNDGSDVFEADPGKLPSRLRRWLGDKLYISIVIYDKDDLDQVRRTFPEARVRLIERNRFFLPPARRWLAPNVLPESFGEL